MSDPIRGVTKWEASNVHLYNKLDLLIIACSRAYPIDLTARHTCPLLAQQVAGAPPWGHLPLAEHRAGAHPMKGGVRLVEIAVPKELFGKYFRLVDTGWPRTAL